MAARLGFGEFELDVAEYTLWREAERVRLQRIPMELLILLATARGALVDRDTIQAALWGAEVFVDQEAAINTAVRKLRKALNDAPDRPRFIETVVGKGYRFAAPVRDLGREAPRSARQPFPRFVIRHAGREFVLREGDNLVGRDPEAEVYIDHPSVSRRHAIIRVAQTRAFIEDARSRNGTFVDGRRVDGPAELPQEGIIGAGPVTLTFETIAAPPSTRPVTRRATS